MNEALRFVHGAVSTKDLVPVLTHICITDGFVQGSNGWLTLCSPIGIEGEMLVPAKPLVKALDSCASPMLEITETAVIVRDASFRVRIPRNTADTFPWSDRPVGRSMPGDWLLAAAKALRPFVGDDATRRWACGIHIVDGYAYATNNVILARTKAPDLGEPVTIPIHALDEVVRINEEPTEIIVGESALGIAWGNRWMRTKQIADPWPDVAGMFKPGTPHELPPGIRAEVERLLPFCPDPDFPVIRLRPDGISTDEGAMSAIVEGYDFPEIKFHGKMLLAMLGAATHADFTKSPALWWGDDVEGIIAPLL